MMIEVSDVLRMCLLIGILLAVNYRKSAGCFNLYGTFLDKPRSGDTGSRDRRVIYLYIILYEDSSILSVSIIVS